MLARRLSATVVVLAGFMSSAAVSNAVELRLLPPNTEIVVTVNVKQILAADLVKSQDKLIKQVKSMIEKQIPGGGGDAIKLLEKMGFDPLKDLTSVTVAHSSVADPKDLFIILEGNFNAPKIEAAAQNLGVKTTKIAGNNVYEISPDANTTVYGSLVGKSMVFTLDKAAMQGAFSRASATNVVATKVAALLKNTSDKQSFSIVMTSKAIMTAGELAQKAPGAGQKIPAEAVNQVTQEINGFSAAVTIGKDVDILLAVGFKAADKAKEMVDLGNGSMFFLKAMVAKQAQAQPQLAPLVDFVDTLKLSSNGSTAVLTGSFTNANVQSLLKDLGNLIK